MVNICFHVVNIVIEFEDIAGNSSERSEALAITVDLNDNAALPRERKRRGAV